VACDNQPVVQVRWAVWRGTQVGNSAAFGIDDVAVTLLANDECTGAVPLALQDPSGCPANAVAGTTVGATDSGADCVVSGTDVWYTITGDIGSAATVFLTPGTATGMGLQVVGACGGGVFYCQPGTQHAIPASFGSTVLIKVFAQTPGTFTICAVRAPVNNSVFFATPLTSSHPDSCTATPGTTTFATNDGTIPCGASPLAGDVWYAVDGGAGFAVNLQLIPGSAADLGIQVFSDNGSTPTYCGTGTFHSFQAIGTNYRVRVFAGTPGSFTICAIRAPENNEQFSATPLPLQHPDSCTALTGNTAFATNSGLNCSFPTAKDVWYAVTGGPSHTARIELVPVTAFNMGIQVFDGNSTETYCATGTSHGFFVPQGATYKVKVFAEEAGSFTICGIRPPVNDEQLSAAPLTLQAPGTCVPLEASLIGATNPFPVASCALPGSVDLWYTVTGGQGFAAHIALTPGTALNMGIQVFNGQGGTETYCAFGNTHSFQVPFGSTYFVKVFALVPGTFTLCATAAPDNNEPFGALPLTLAQPGACTPLVASTTFATNSGTGCSSSLVNDVWFAVTGGQGMAATIELTPITATALGIQVLNGQGGAETYCGSGNTHTFMVPFGSTYFVKVFAAGTPGSFSICAIAAPDNNESFSPVALTPAAPGSCTPLSASTVHATALDPNCVGTDTRDLWYTVPSVPGQTITIELVPGTATGLGIQVFENQFGSVGAELYCGAGNQHTFNVPVGQSRFVKVITSTPGTFTICAIETVVECLVNSDCNDNDACTIDACLANTCVSAPLISVDEVLEAPDTTCLNGSIQLGTTVLTRGPVNQYVFSTGTGATLDPMTGASFLLFQLNDDLPTSFPSPIGFAFPFNGTLFDHFSVSPDGWLQLGMGTATPEPLNNVTSTANLPRIYPYWDDMQTGNSVFTSGVRSRMTGTAPDRILKVQWDVCIPKTNPAPNSQFQVWLHENGMVEFRYGTMGGASMSASAGITAGASNFQSVTIATNTVSITVPDNANSGQPAIGRFYRFTLPTAAVTGHLWSPPTFLSSTTAAQPVASGINVPAQAYSVQVTSTAGCQASDAFTVHTAPPMTSASITGAPSYCAGGGSTTLTAVPVGGGAPFSYLWSPGGHTTQSIIVNTAGAYSCAITNPCGTVNSNVVNVVELPQPTASAANNGPICAGDTLQLDGTTDIGTSGVWSFEYTCCGSPFNGVDVVVPNAQQDKDGVWTFVAISSDGCSSAPATTTVAVNSIPTVSFPTATPGSLCAGGNSQLKVVASAFPGAMEQQDIPFAPITGSGTAITNWSNGGGGTANDGYSTAITMPFTFRYDGMPFNQLFVGANGHITFLDPAGITAQQSRTSSNMRSTALPNAVVALCFADLNVVAPGVVRTFTSGNPGSRIFVIEYSNVPFAPNTGSMSGQIHLHETTNIIEVHLGTFNFGTSTATSPNLRWAGVEKRDGTNNSVFAGNISWRFTPLEYQWAPTTFLNDATIAEPFAASVTSTTMYTVTVNNSGCLRTRTVTVTAAQPVSSATITGVPILCNGASTTLTAVPNSGLAHTYLWSPGGQTTASITVNAPGVYSCQVGDACGGSANGSVTVTSAVESCNGVDDDCDGLTDEGCGVFVSARVLLEGPYNSTTGLMNDPLRTLPSFPLTEPYTAAGYVHAGGGGEIVAPAVLAITGNDAIVDWVVLELRSAVTPSSIVASRSALLQRDGDVVDVDGLSPVLFTATPSNYHVAVRHRNHLGVMTAASVAISPVTTAVDLTTPATATFGANARKSIAGTFPAHVLWAGDVTFNGQLKYTGTANDRDPILLRIGGSVPTAIANGYFVEDVTMDGVVKYTNASNDRDAILVNILSLPGGTVLSTRSEQLP
jgi:hypothetical protein